MLDRSAVDVSCKDVTKLIFEGGPELGPGLAQEARPATPYAGRVLDTLRACPPLSEAEGAEYRRLVDDAKAAAQPEAERVRAEWEAGHFKARMDKGMSEADAREAVSRIGDGGELDLAFNLHFQRLGVVAVWEVMADPKKYVGQALADPIEGAHTESAQRSSTSDRTARFISSCSRMAAVTMPYPRPTVLRPRTYSTRSTQTLERIKQAEQERKRAKAKAKAEPETNPGGGINFRDVQVKRAPYVMKGWLHGGETVQWFGPPGAGKSASLLSVMLASAAAPSEGAMLAGCRVKRGLAIFAAYERAGETQDRLAAARKRRMSISAEI
jgi:AAA domain